MHKARSKDYISTYTLTCHQIEESKLFDILIDNSRCPNKDWLPDYVAFCISEDDSVRRAVVEDSKNR